MLAAWVGGSPAWWLDQDDKMLATGVALMEKLVKART